MVGGYLRESLLSLPLGRDIDIAVAGDSQSIGRELARVLGGTFVPLNPGLGKARIVARECGAGRWQVDLSGFTGAIEEDLARRDFTINAVALPVAHWGEKASAELLIDPFNGQMDLARKSIRTVGPRVFKDDPGRLLRSVRLAAALGFRIEPETARRVVTDAHLVERVAAERVRDEFLTILSLDGAKGSLQVLDRLDLLCRIVPELADTKGVEQPIVHYWDVWGHLLHAVEHAERITKGHQNSPIFTLIYWTEDTDAYFGQQVFDGHSRRTLLKLAALFHDIAKPQTKQKDADGRTRFPGHSEAGAEMADGRLARLRIESKGIEMVHKMVEHHLRPSHMMQGVAVPTERAIRRYFRDVGNVAIDTLYLCQADFLAAKGPELNASDWAKHARMVAHVVQAGFQQESPKTARRLVNGSELIEHFRLVPGPIVGRLLDRIEEAQALGDISTPEEALALAAQNLGGDLRRSTHPQDAGEDKEEDGACRH